jgi:hypothetical protein
MVVVAEEDEGVCSRMVVVVVISMTSLVVFMLDLITTVAEVGEVTGVV